MASITASTFLGSFTAASSWPVHDHPVVAMPAHGVSQDAPLQVAAEVLQVLHHVAVGDPADVLLDDRPGIQLRGHVVRGRAHDLDAAIVGLPVRVRPDEGRQEGMVDVDHRVREARHEARREDLHVPREHDEVGLSLEEPEHAFLGLGPLGGLVGHVHEGHGEWPDRGSEVLVEERVVLP